MKDKEWRVGYISWSPDYKSEKPIPQVAPPSPPKPPRKPRSPAKPDENRPNKKA